MRNVLALAAVLVAAPGCAMGGVFDGVGLPGVGRDVLDGEVRSVDARRGWLQVREWDGRTRSVSVGRETRVRYDRRDYPVSALERGDEVRVHLSFDRRGEAWAERIDVRRSVRDGRYDRDDRVYRRDDRDGRVYDGRTTRLDGTLRRMNVRDGWIVVDRGRRDGEVVVYFGSRTDRQDVRRLERLRRGDRVRLDVVSRGRDEAELVRVR